VDANGKTIPASEVVQDSYIRQKARGAGLLAEFIHWSTGLIDVPEWEERSEAKARILIDR
jgi:hypothetical protein